ncbi:uncharacterized protein CTHT_0074450 [Thermochaetoides thermophila DSM 1495]|uniref:Uncharacterized protein n=1 Tax=Chaetomium thermophilum (strain DSM 1495 / CBS 144.50 / IMI 039719) TaxID=759272 RepID=G0SI45_CHATD|nr:hypothetical protein CTHT_0074450 [Thermochaetoides thermophila DSM 1495]EGS17115.1 hypothetical protein CTHT_0074450 [Thermochaetoides thermophila DSM 1495]
MKLISVLTREVEEFHDDKVPPYAILSHVWGPENDEVTAQDLQGIAQHRKAQREARRNNAPLLTQGHHHHEPISGVNGVNGHSSTGRPSLDSTETMRLMLLTSMLMAFRGKTSPSIGNNLLRNLPALKDTTSTTTNGYSESYEIERANRNGESHHQRYSSLEVLAQAAASASTHQSTNTGPHPAELKPGYQKILYAVEQAEKDGFEYVWVDTACIDRTSSTDVSEAINSAFQWYSRAGICYAYLADVQADDNIEGYRTWLDLFNMSRWFKRAWTLPELLAPKKLVFYAKGWKLLGTKSSLVKHVARVTKIDEVTLIEPKLVHKASIAQRLAWAAGRQASRPEDVAYSLLGLFGIHMPIVYGEGAEAAFQRLQEEIIKRSDDHSIFAWGILNQLLGPKPRHTNTLPPSALCLDEEADDESDENLAGATPILARSPDDFANMQFVIVPQSPEVNAPAGVADYSMTNKGLHITLPLLPDPAGGARYVLALLPCHLSSDPSHRLAIPLSVTAIPNVYLRVKPGTLGAPSSEALLVPVSVLKEGKCENKRIYIPNVTEQIARLRQREEIIFLRATDVFSPGYEIVQVCGLGGKFATFDRKANVVKVGAVSVTGAGGAEMDEEEVRRMMSKNRAALYRLVVCQLAVVAFWSQHIKSGFIARILVEVTPSGQGGRCWVDLASDPRINSQDQICAEAQRLWEDPGSVDVTIPSLTGSPGVQMVTMEIVHPERYQPGVSGLDLSEGGWSTVQSAKLGVFDNCTFVEMWEREYMRTVQAKLERKKKGLMELSMTSMLWMAPDKV